jgi:hypothetical protein
MKKRVILLSLVSVSAVMSAMPTYADEVRSTTTTTTTQPGPGVSVGVPGVVGVQIGAPATGCTTRSTTKSNTDTGDSKTVTRSDC